MALSIRFRKPNDAIVFKYTLASEEVYYGNELRHYTHVYVMKGITKEKIDNLIEELHKPGAFPEDIPKPTMELPLSIGVIHLFIYLNRQFY